MDHREAYREESSVKEAQNHFGYLTIVAVLLLVLAYPAVGQTNRYVQDGLSFSYPAGWSLTDGSDVLVQSLALDRGKDEAKIMVVSLRRTMNVAEIAEAQPKLTEVIATELAQAMQQPGAQVRGSAISAVIGGIQAQGIRLRASLHDEAGIADVYQFVLGGRLVNVIFIGSDRERLRAAYAWNMFCSTLQMSTPAGATPAPTSSRPQPQ